MFKQGQINSVAVAAARPHLDETTSIGLWYVLLVASRLNIEAHAGGNEPVTVLLIQGLLLTIFVKHGKVEMKAEHCCIEANRVTVEEKCSTSRDEQLV